MGHLFVIDGDLTKLACDAWLLPTSTWLEVTDSFRHALDGAPTRLPERYDFGGRRAIPYHSSAPENGPWIWLGDIGRRWVDDGTQRTLGPAKQWFITELVDEFAREASDGIRNSRDCLVPPRLAINVLGSGYGGLADDKGTIYQALIPAALHAVDAHDVDLVLVTWGERAYAAAQRSRRHMLADTGVAPQDTWRLLRGELHDEAHRLAGYAQHTDLVLFLGAGVSAGVGLPSWQELLNALSEKIGEPNLTPAALRRLDPRDQAALLERAARRNDIDVRAEICSLLDTDRCSLLHGLLTSLRPREAVTTNYDCCYELAYPTHDGSRLAVLPWEPVTAGQPWVLKLHGSVDPSHEGDLVLTRADYLGTSRTHGALFGIVQALLLTRHMLFVGYSLTDEDFHELVHEVRQALQGQPEGTSRTFGTVLTLFDDPLNAGLWQDDLEIIPMVTRPNSGGEAAGSGAEPAATRPTTAEIAVAARQLEIFLDLVGAEASGLERFLLDPTFDEMLTDDERLLRDALEALLREIGERRLDATAVGRELRDLAARCGRERS